MPKTTSQPCLFPDLLQGNIAPIYDPSTTGPASKRRSRTIRKFECRGELKIKPGQVVVTEIEVNHQVIIAISGLDISHAKA